jgi:glucose/arabinose dehydrogenase
MNSLKRYAWLLVLLPLSVALYCKKSDKMSVTPPVEVNDSLPKDTVIKDTIPPPTDTVVAVLDTMVEIKDSVIAENLNFPWEILWGPDNHIWFTERGGRISRLDPLTGAINPLLTVPDVKATGEGGMLGMVLHPNFSMVPHLFVVYNYQNGGKYMERIVRYTYNGTTLIDPTPIFDGIRSGTTHAGSRLVITKDLKLFISLGDGANLTWAQNLSVANGKILRLNLDGSIPPDNPIPGNPLWTLGHRNPQGLVFANDKLYSAEHGPFNNDELNIIEKGRNYGWSTIEGICDLPGEMVFCDTNNVAEPFKTFSPSVAGSGLDYYDKNLIPQWKNSLILVALKNQRLYQLKLDTNTFSTVISTNEYFKGKYGRLRDVCISPAGKVYICSSNGGNTDKIFVVDKK